MTNSNVATGAWLVMNWNISLYGQNKCLNGTSIDSKNR